MEFILRQIHRFVEVEHDIYSTQSKGCWLCIRIGYTVFYFPKLWGTSKWQGFRVDIFAPVHGPRGWLRRSVCMRSGRTKTRKKE